LLVDSTFGSEELSEYSPYIQQDEESPYLLMHEKDSSARGLSHGDGVVLNLPGGPVRIKLHTSKNMAQGIMVMPRSRKIGWRKITEWPVIVPREAIEKL
jgi:anaerobic selenocysteine-containing dehydrogenase